MQVLMVHAPFGDYRRGDFIKDAAQMADASEHHPHYVTPCQVPDWFFMDDAAAAAAMKAAQDATDAANKTAAKAKA